MLSNKYLVHVFTSHIIRASWSLRDLASVSNTFWDFQTSNRFCKFSQLDFCLLQCRQIRCLFKSFWTHQSLLLVYWWTANTWSLPWGLKKALTLFLNYIKRNFVDSSFESFEWISDSTWLCWLDWIVATLLDIDLTSNDAICAFSALWAPFSSESLDLLFFAALVLGSCVSLRFPSTLSDPAESASWKNCKRLSNMYRKKIKVQNFSLKESDINIKQSVVNYPHFSPHSIANIVQSLVVTFWCQLGNFLIFLLSSLIFPWQQTFTVVFLSEQLVNPFVVTPNSSVYIPWKGTELPLKIFQE